MRQLELTRSALQDLRSIARHTQARWGVAQRNAYLRGIDQAFRSLAENPVLGRACDEIRSGYRKLTHGRHVIYYKAADHEVLVVRILHVSMDAESGIDS